MLASFEIRFLCKHARQDTKDCKIAMRGLDY
jgi:hypothetical protein